MQHRFPEFNGNFSELLNLYFTLHDGYQKYISMLNPIVGKVSSKKDNTDPTTDECIMFPVDDKIIRNGHLRSSIKKEGQKANRLLKSELISFARFDLCRTERRQTNKRRKKLGLPRIKRKSITEGGKPILPKMSTRKLLGHCGDSKFVGQGEKETNVGQDTYAIFNTTLADQLTAAWLLRITPTRGDFLFVKKLQKINEKLIFEVYNV